MAWEASVLQLAPEHPLRPSYRALTSGTANTLEESTVKDGSKERDRMKGAVTGSMKGEGS